MRLLAVARRASLAGLQNIGQKSQTDLNRMTACLFSYSLLISHIFRQSKRPDKWNQITITAYKEVQMTGHFEDKATALIGRLQRKGHYRKQRDDNKERMLLVICR